MILNTYLFFSAVIASIFSIAYVKKSRETVLRVVSFFGILNLVSLAYILGVAAVSVLATVILALSSYELIKNYKLRNPVPFILIVAGGYLFILYYRPDPVYLLPVFFLMAGLAFAVPADMVKSHLFVHLFGAAFLSVSTASIVLLFRLNPDTIILLIAMPAFNDVTGYFAGRKFGKIHPFPVLSPKKTLGGYAGGLMGLLAGLVLFHTFIPILTGTSFWQNMILLVALFLFDNAGDLLFSKIKRSVGTKDFSSLLPGHGGILDRFDSVLMVAPVLLVLVFLK